MSNPGWNLELRDSIVCDLVFRHRFFCEQTSTSLTHRVRMSCEIYELGAWGGGGKGRGPHPDPAQGSYQRSGIILSKKDLWSILYFCPKRQAGHKGEASYRESVLAGPALCSGFPIVIHKRQAGEAHRRQLLFSWDHGLLWS